MLNKRNFIVLLILGLLAVFFFPPAYADNLVPQGLTSQRVAIPSYFYPCTGTRKCYWDQLNNGYPAVGIGIINPDSGPGTAQDPSYFEQTVRTKQAGILILGYVYTSYGSRPIDQVKADVDLYYLWYGVDSIFFDEASTDCLDQSYYQRLFDYVKTKSRDQNKVVLNPGINTMECYMAAADIIVNFEDTYSAYVSWQPSGWEYNYSSDRFWHLVYKTSKSNMLKAVQLSKNRQAGWIYVTSDKLSNPWDTLPSGSYWDIELLYVNQ